MKGVKVFLESGGDSNPLQLNPLGRPLCSLYAFKNVPQFRILIGGGDGTFGWVLAALQEMKDVLLCKDPPSALLPLGTGEAHHRILMELYKS